MHYCAEQFENDGSLSLTLLKTIKRTMAGEYTLSIASGYIERLLANSRIEKHLEKHHRDILGELRALLAELKPQKDKTSETAA